MASLLNKLLIEFTKSRSKQTNDNALVKSKHASIVRKQFGHTNIPELINKFKRGYLNTYVNFHLLFFFEEKMVEKTGKEKRCYRYGKMMTPYEKFKSLKKPESHPKKGLL